MTTMTDDDVESRARRELAGLDLSDRHYAGVRPPAGARPSAAERDAGVIVAGPSVWVLDPAETDGPRLLRHVALHSPTGMEWGYGGSGPADCALSILVDALDEWRKVMRFRPADEHRPSNLMATDRVRAIERTRAWSLHQRFKFDVVARLTTDVGTPAWLLGQAEVRAWARKAWAERAAS